MSDDGSTDILPLRPKSETPTAVCIRFAGRQQARLSRPDAERGQCRDPLWTDRPILLQRADGTCQLIGTTTRPDALARWVLGFGRDAEVESPPALRRRVAQAARAVCRLYADLPDA